MKTSKNHTLQFAVTGALLLGSAGAPTDVGCGLPETGIEPESAAVDAELRAKEDRNRHPGPVAPPLRLRAAEPPAVVNPGPVPSAGR